MYVGETGCNVGTKKREHVDAVKTFHSKKLALNRNVMDLDRRIDWDDVKVPKSSHKHTVVALQKVL